MQAVLMYNRNPIPTFSVPNSDPVLAHSALCPTSLAPLALFFSDSAGYLAICFAIEYLKTFPKLLGMLNPDPRVPTTAGEASRRQRSYSLPRGDGFEPLVGTDLTDVLSDDEDVAAEALRVEEIFGLGGGADRRGEVVLKGLRKVYRTKQVQSVPKTAIACRIILARQKRIDGGALCVQ